MLLLSSGTPAPGRSKAYTTLTQNQLLDFRYAYPTSVGSYPALLARLQADERKSYSEELDGARDEAEFSAEKKFPFNRHEFWRDWTSTGETSRLIGLECRTFTFEGGAHPNHTSAWLLWDKKRDAAVGLKELFVPRSDFWATLRASYCSGLGQERRRRKLSVTNRCPTPDQLTIEFLDPDLNWTFDTLRIIADPYVAGVYAEGTYAVTLPVPAQLIAMVKPEYRDSFEAQRQ